MRELRKIVLWESGDCHEADSMSSFRQVSGSNEGHWIPSRETESGAPDHGN